MSAKVKQYLPWVIMGLLAALCLYLALNQNSGQTSVQLELKNQQIAALSKDRDSLKVIVSKWERLNRDTTAKDSIRQYKTKSDSLEKQLRSIKATQYALARQVKAAQDAKDQSSLDSACPALADRVLLDSQTIASLSTVHGETIKTYEAVLGVKDSVINAQANLIHVDDELIQSQRDAAALQSAELKKVKKQSKLKGTIAAIGGGLALVGWVLLSLK
jgi:hypothetical protein